MLHTDLNQITFDTSIESQLSEQIHKITKLTEIFAPKSTKTMHI